MMKNVLCVSPHFPPVNAADMHRIRLSAPLMPNYGWTATVLAVKPEYVELARDDDLEKSLQDCVAVYRSGAIPHSITRHLGLGNLGIRSFVHLLLKGSQILRTKKFDLVYFSTSVFDCIPVGRIWRRKFNVPFVIDLQDPWRNDYHLNSAREDRPPKFEFDHIIKSHTEKWALPKADGLTSVSEKYLQDIYSRYRNFSNIPKLVLPFCAAETDFEYVDRAYIPNRVFRPQQGALNMVYTGVVPTSMIFTISVVLKALRKLISKGLPDLVPRLHFIGTDYATGERARARVLPIAREIGVDHLVNEQPQRVPYFEALKLMKDADLLLLPGTTDGGYTASKIFPYVLSQTPVFALFHERSNSCEFLEKSGAGKLVKFGEQTAESGLVDIVENILRDILDQRTKRQEIDWAYFDQFSAHRMTEKLCALFDEVITRY